MTARPRPQRFKANLIREGRVLWPGDYQFQDAAGRPCLKPGSIARIELCCPVSGERVVVDPVGYRQPWRRPSWLVTGSVFEASVYPEIETPAGWRGYLREGRFVAEGRAAHG